MKVNISHKKRATTEEINKKLDNIPEDIDALPADQVNTPKDEEELPIDETPVDDKPKEDETKDENPEEVDETPVDEPPAEDEPPVEQGNFDYKRKFQESSREASIIASKNRKITETIEEAAQLPEPTDEELRKEYSDWDSLTDFEQKMAKQALASSKKFNLIHKAVIENTKTDAWAKNVDEFIEKPANLQKYPDLDGKEAEFRSFAMKESRRGVDFEDLVASFLYTIEKTVVTPKHTGTLLGRSNGSIVPKKPTELTIEQIAYIRKTDSRKYRQLIKEGKIKINV